MENLKEHLADMKVKSNNTQMGNDNMKVPEGWKRVRLGEVLAKEHLKVGIKNKNIYIPVAVGELGLRDRTEIYGEDKILTENTERYLIFPYASVCFGLGSKSLAVDVNDALNSKYSVSPAYKIFKFDYKKYNPSFFRKYFKFLKDCIGDKFLVISARQGKKIDEEILLNYTVSLPPLPEQQKIAEILETVDRAIEKTDKIIEKYKRIKQGLMQDLLTKGIDENGKIRSEKTHKFKDSPLGRIPEEWEVVRLGEVVNLRLSNVDKKIFDREKKVLLCNYLEVYQNDYITKKLNFMIGSVNNREFEKFKIYKGDVIITKDSEEFNDIAKSAYVRDEIDNLVCGYHLALLKVKDNIEGLFLSRILAFPSINIHFQKQANGITRFGITKETIENAFIPLPPLPEQQRIAEILSQIDNTIEKEEAYKQKLERIKKGLMEDLLTGRVRVNKLIDIKEIKKKALRYEPES